MPSFSVLPGSGGFLFPGLALVSEYKPFPADVGVSGKISLMKLLKNTWLAAAFALLAAALQTRAVGINETFSTDPLQNGWQVFGATNLIQWNPTNQNLDVTWDSTQPNTYFYHPLGITLTSQYNFTVAFDLQISNAVAYNYGFELAIGLINFQEATNAVFNRSTGTNSPDLVEFDFFPDVGYGPTVWPLFVDSNSVFNWNGPSDYAIYQPAPGDWYHVVMDYNALYRTMTTTMTNFEGTSGIVISDPISTNLSDFRVDTFSVSSYGDDGYGDSIYAQGAVDNISVTVPPMPVLGLTGQFQDGRWVAKFGSSTGWTYTLQCTTDLQTWTDVSAPAAGNGTNLFLRDTNSVGAQGFYRVRATQP